MIVNQLSLVPDGATDRYAWTGLSRFENVSFVSKRLAATHPSQENNASNFRKQATQIRYCILQAKEYFSAAASVSLSTRPLLLYYGLMSLALSEILFKQDGNSSLDRAREHHRHHGLELRQHGRVRTQMTLGESAALISAAPLIITKGGSEVRTGTFDLWHRTARDAPSCGATKRQFANGLTLESNGVLMIAEDIRSPLIPAHGMTLLDCFRSTPGMIPALGQYGVAESLVRARISRQDNEMVHRSVSQLILQPGRIDDVDRVLARIFVKPGDVDRIECTPMSGAYIINMNFEIDGVPIFARMPASVQENIADIYFPVEDVPVNEFGIYYMGLYILGNYARYFPDLWMADVESASDLSQCAAEFISIAERRVPLLALSELNRTSYLYS